MASIEINSNGVSQISIAGTPTVNVGTSGLPTGAATEAKQDTGNSSLSTISTKTTNIDNKLPALVTTTPASAASAVTVAQRPITFWRDEFDGTSLDTTTNWTLVQTGAGMTVDVLGSSLRLQTGLTADAETIIRSKATYSGDIALKYLAMSSQRIVNSEFIVELVDAHPTKVSGASYSRATYSTTCTGTTTADSNQITGFTGVVPVLGALIAGTGIPSQSYITAISGAGPYTLTLNQTCTASGTLTNTVTHNATKITTNGLTQGLKYLQWIEVCTVGGGGAIADFNYTTNGNRCLVTYVDPGDTYITVVTGATTTATGTVSYYPITGNQIGAHYEQASATAWRNIVHGNGYNYAGRVLVGNSQATVTQTTSATPGHVASIHWDGQFVSFSDAAAVATGVNSIRTVRDSDIPAASTQFYIQIRLKNIIAPATNTYWYVDWIAVETHNESQVRLTSNANAVGKETIPVQVITSATVTVTAAGANADDSATLASPIIIGGKTINAIPTASSNADTGNMILDLRRRNIVYGQQVRELATVELTTIATSTTETTIVASVASILKDITTLIVSNSGGVDCTVTIKDSTGGTTRCIISVKTGDTVTVSFPTPMKQATAANNWTATCSVNTTTINITAISVQS